jgi:hypothetical protein
MIKFKSNSNLIDVQKHISYSDDGPEVEVSINIPVLETMYYQFNYWLDEQNREQELRERNPELKEFYDKYKMLLKLAGENR